MPTYSDSDSLRNERFARTKNLFNGVWEDDADSDATIDLDDETPYIRIEHDIAVMYYGKYRMYDLELVSGIRTDDRMYTFRGDIIPNHDVVKVYKEISRVLDAKILSFPGTYGCSTNYTGVQDAVCQADDVVPYYYTDESPLRGTVDFDKLLPAGEDEQRRVIIVNVTRGGTRLRDQGVIPENSVIYLAGQHTPEQHASFERRFASNRENCNDCDDSTQAAQDTTKDGHRASRVHRVQETRVTNVGFSCTKENEYRTKDAHDESYGERTGNNADRAEEAAVTDVNLDALTEVADPPHLPPAQVGDNDMQTPVVAQFHPRHPPEDMAMLIGDILGEGVKNTRGCQSESPMVGAGERCGLDEAATISRKMSTMVVSDVGSLIDGVTPGVVKAQTP